MNPVHFTVVFLISYSIGSVPFAFLAVKLFYKQDLRKTGSGDVGALNAYRIRKNKPLALSIALFDLFKGMLPVWYGLTQYPQDFTVVIVAVGGVLLGDLFPVWLGFKGGRGLNVAAGALLVVEPRLVLIWLVLFFVFYLFIRQHIIANMIATFGLPVFVFFTQNIYFTDDTLLLILIVSMLIFQRHLERIPDLVEQKRFKISNGDEP
ncbi:MAG: hypothetical protein GXO77_14780 [Calditrichaeota bacterium]|nr:hypothetical protein [Calditrichota bacterium]